jgi:hypothetical protein
MMQRTILAKKVGCAAVLLFACAAVAAEQVNKCTDPTGKVVYQKEPCEQSQQREEKQINPDHNSIKMELPPPSEEKPKSEGKPSSATPDASPRQERRKGY